MKELRPAAEGVSSPYTSMTWKLNYYFSHNNNFFLFYKPLTMFPNELDFEAASKRNGLANEKSPT